MLGINLYKALEKERKKRFNGDLIEEVNQLLNHDVDHESSIIKRIFSAEQNGAKILDLQIDAFKIYTIEDIRNICIKYRLRFLDSHRFKGEIPYEAVRKIKYLEKEADVELSAFKIIAPSEFFNLTDKDADPLLLLDLGNNRYCLIHKWGKELNPLRYLWTFPFRNFMSLFSCVMLLALVVTLAIPFEGIWDQFIFKAYVFMYALIGLSGLTAFAFFAFRQNFSNSIWDSPHFN